MNLKEITNLLFVKKTTGNMETEITGLQMDSRKIEKGNLFICISGIEGFLTDRHSYAKDAIKNGAVALIVEREVEVDVPMIFVHDARYAMAVIANQFYHYPSNEMRLIGITGTNGKTTTAYITEKILSDYNLRTGLMGNNGVKINDQIHPTDINTQEPPSLQKNLSLMKEHKTDYCIMEVSSQGIEMGRVIGCNFRTAIFTNLTQDHLDYHGSFEEYKKVKGLLFSRLGNGTYPEDKKYAVLNADDPSFEYFKKQAVVQIITYGITNQADVTAKNIFMNSQGIQFTLHSFKGEININLNLVGKFNVYNVLAGITATLVEGVPLESIKNSLFTLKSIDGRMEIVDEGQEFLVLVDYAHTPDALENVLQSIKEFSQEKIITVFGCGGDRDNTKRPLMGNIASEYSDYVFVTSDNPRSEDPENILKDIEKGITKSNFSDYQLIVNREKAIQSAISTAAPNDIILIAGKGHETYQILKDKTISFDDKEVASKVIKQLYKKGK